MHWEMYYDVKPLLDEPGARDCHDSISKVSYSLPKLLAQSAIKGVNCVECKLLHC